MAKAPSSTADSIFGAGTMKVEGLNAFEVAVSASFKQPEDAFRAVWQATASVGRFTSLGSSLSSVVEAAKFPDLGLFRMDSGFLQQLVPKVRTSSPIRQKDLRMMAQHGWYLDPEMPVTTPSSIVQALQEESAKDVEAALVCHFQERVNEIEIDVASSFPQRKHILLDAFEAHRDGKYNLSVPTLLAQADGMCNETWAFCVFMGKDRARESADLVRNSNSDMRKQLVGLLGDPIPLWQSVKRRGAGFSGLNRHQVLHGESVSYGTKTNSLKAISFLRYLCFILDS